MKWFEELKERWRQEYALAEFRVESLRQGLEARKQAKKPRSPPPTGEDSSNEEVLL